MMPLLMVLFIAVATLSILVATAMHVLSRWPNSKRAEADFAARWSRDELALLSGGVVRSTDAILVDLLGKGLVHAQHGVLALSAQGESQADLPLDRRHPQASSRFAENAVLLAVRNFGAEGIDAVRRNVTVWTQRHLLRGLSKRGLLISMGRRQWEPMLVIGPALLLMFLISMGLMMSSSDQLYTTFSIVGWLVVTAILLAILMTRPGYAGRSPVTGRARNMLAYARKNLPLDASQADRVALDGFAGMTDAGLRQQIQGHAIDSAWHIVRQNKRNPDINAQRTAAVGWFVSSRTFGEFR